MNLFTWNIGFYTHPALADFVNACLVFGRSSFCASRLSILFPLHLNNIFCFIGGRGGMWDESFFSEKPGTMIVGAAFAGKIWMWVAHHGISVIFARAGCTRLWRPIIRLDAELLTDSLAGVSGMTTHSWAITTCQLMGSKQIIGSRHCASRVKRLRFDPRHEGASDRVNFTSWTNWRSIRLLQLPGSLGIKLPLFINYVWISPGSAIFNNDSFVWARAGTSRILMHLHGLLWPDAPGAWFLSNLQEWFLLCRYSLAYHCCEAGIEDNNVVFILCSGAFVACSFGFKTWKKDGSPSVDAPDDRHFSPGD